MRYKSLHCLWRKYCNRKAWIRELWLTGKYSKKSLNRLVRIDEHYLSFAANIEFEWRQWKRQNLPQTEQEWLKVFPEVKKDLPEIITNLNERTMKAKSEIQNVLKEIEKYDKAEDRLFWREIVKYTFKPVWELAKANKQMEKLKWLLARPRAKNIKWQNALNYARQRNIIDLAERYGVNLKKAGRLFRGLCPLHSEKTPSFFIYPDKNRFVCFGCNAKGDVISFVQQIEKCDFKEAIYKLQN